MINSKEALKQQCPIFSSPSLCKGEMCMGWHTQITKVNDKEIADEVFVDAYLVHAGPEEIHEAVDGKIGIWVGIRNGILLQGKMSQDPETFKPIPHEEIMKVNSKGERSWLEKIKNRKPSGKDIELKNPRNIQYNTGEQRFYWIYDAPVTEHIGYCTMIK